VIEFGSGLRNEEGPIIMAGTNNGGESPVMKAEELMALPKETLMTMLQVMIDNYRSVDGLWFQFVEKEYGTQKAVELDEAVWKVLGKIEGRRVKQVFGLTGAGIPAIVEALRINPSLRAFGPSGAEQTGDDQLKYSVFSCLSQQARLEKGQELFECRGVQQGYLSSFAAQFEPNVAVECLLCPPDHHRDDLWCQWMFEVREDGGSPVSNSHGDPGG
jgi:hypothetical protein